MIATKILSRVARRIAYTKDAYLWQIGSYLREKLALPSQTSRDRKIFKRVFKQYAGKKLRVFEWGSGRSTTYYSRYLASIGSDFEWHAIDNSQKWRDRVAQLVNRYCLQNRVHLYLSEFSRITGLVKREGKIPEGICIPAVTDYVEYPRRVRGEEGFDIIIVDGRFRRRCLLVAAEVLAPEGLVLLHDAQRIHYHSSLALYKFGRFFDTGNLPGSKTKIKTWIGTRDPARTPDILSL